MQKTCTKLTSKPLNRAKHVWYSKGMPFSFSCLSSSGCQFRFVVCKASAQQLKLVSTVLVVLFQLFFIKRLAILIFHLLSISIAVYTRPEVGDSLLVGIKENTEEIDSVEITRYYLLCISKNTTTISFFSRVAACMKVFFLGF